jgi:hypothetical protein
MRMHKRAVVISLVLALILSVGIVTVVAAVGPASVLHLAAVVTHQGGSTNGGSNHSAGGSSGSSGSATNSDGHGDAVSHAAHTCPHGAHGVHGECVSAVATSTVGKK